MKVNYPIIDADGHVLEKDRELHPALKPIPIFPHSMVGIAAPASPAKILKPRRRAGCNSSTSSAST